jgi:hypothetical protein
MHCVAASLGCEVGRRVVRTERNLIVDVEPRQRSAGSSLARAPLCAVTRSREIEIPRSAPSRASAPEVEVGTDL